MNHEALRSTNATTPGKQQPEAFCLAIGAVIVSHRSTFKTKSSCYIVHVQSQHELAVIPLPTELIRGILLRIVFIWSRIVTQGDTVVGATLYISTSALVRHLCKKRWDHMVTKQTLFLHSITPHCKQKSTIKFSALDGPCGTCKIENLKHSGSFKKKKKKKNGHCYIPTCTYQMTGCTRAALLTLGFFATVALQ
jgi:hypothetical protein